MRRKTPAGVRRICQTVRDTIIMSDEWSSYSDYGFDLLPLSESADPELETQTLEAQRVAPRCPERETQMWRLQRASL